MFISFVYWKWDTTTISMPHFAFKENMVVSTKYHLVLHCLLSNNKLKNKVQIYFPPTRNENSNALYNPCNYGTRQNLINQKKMSCSFIILKFYCTGTLLPQLIKNKSKLGYRHYQFSYFCIVFNFVTCYFSRCWDVQR